MPRTLPVESRNQWFQLVEALQRNRKKRHREGLFVVEGVRSLNQLVASPAWEIEAFLYAPARRASPWARQMLDESRASHHLELSVPLMDELSDKDEGSELLGVARIPDDDPARLSSGDGTPLWVVLDQPVLPGNLGSTIRSCDALGVDGMIVSGRAADLYDPRTVRGAAGSLFSLPAVRVPTWGGMRGWLEEVRARHHRLQVLASSAHGGQWPDDVDLTTPTVLVLGNETSGIRRGLGELCDARVSIPMVGAASSLNLACAGTAILYEVLRQRRSVGLLSGGTRRRGVETGGGS